MFSFQPPRSSHNNKFVASHHGSTNFRRLRRARCDVREADLVGWPRVHREAWACIDIGNYQGWVEARGRGRVEIMTRHDTNFIDNFPVVAMLSGPGQFAENEANEVNFREIPWVDSSTLDRVQIINANLFNFSSHVLQKVCMYFTYKVRYTNSSTEIPEFPIAPEIA